MMIKQNKCFFIHESIEYLGRIVEPKALSIALKTIDALKMTASKNKTKLRSFLGLCNVYRIFAKDFASVATPLNKQLKKPESDHFTMTDEKMEKVEELKNCRTSQPVLACRAPINGTSSIQTPMKTNLGAS